jgi:hypothetical protein
MLDERPPAELPARASAMAGANARVVQTKSARKMRQLHNRLDMAPPVRKVLEERWFA